jgi:hypothetical protein
VSDPFAQGERPGTRPIERLLLLRRDLCAAQDGACAVDQQRALVGLVAAHVGAHVVRRQQLDAMPDALEAPSPAVCRAAGFHHDAQRFAVIECGSKGTAAQPAPFDDASLCVREGQFERVLGEVNRAVEVGSDSGVACMADSSRDPVS